MSSGNAFIGKPAPDFKATAVMPDGQFKDIKLSDYKGKSNKACWIGRGVVVEHYVDKQDLGPKTGSLLLKYFLFKVAKIQFEHLTTGLYQNALCMGMEHLNYEK